VSAPQNRRTFADELTIVGENRRRLGNLSELNSTRLALSLQRFSKHNEHEKDYDVNGSYAADRLFKGQRSDGRAG
jgi:hypothetical protein